MATKTKAPQFATLNDAQRNGIADAIGGTIRNKAKELEHQHTAIMKACKGVAALPLAEPDVDAVWSIVETRRKAEGMTDDSLKVAKSRTRKLARCSPILARNDISFLESRDEIFGFCTVLQNSEFDFARAKREWSKEVEPDYAASVAAHFKSVLGSKAGKAKWTSTDARAAIALVAMKCGIKIGEDYAALADMDRAKRFLGL